jgi:FlgD Ig-like domain
MNGFIRAITALCATAFLIACFGTASASANSWGSFLSGFNRCDPSVGTSTYQLTTWLDGTAHDWFDQDVRLEVTGGPGSWSGGLSWPASGSYWLSGVDLPWGATPPTGTVNCASAPQSFNYTIDYGPIPETPTWFEGDSPTGGPTSSFAFTTPELDPYQALVRVYEGSITLRFGNRSQTFSEGSSTFDLGVLDAGRQTIAVDGAGSSGGSYSIYLEAPKAYITDLSPVYARPGASVRVPLTLAAAAVVRQRTTDLNDNVVQYAVDGALGYGHQAVTWNATDDQGKALPEGRYKLRLAASSDSDVSSAEASTTAVVDGTPPHVGVVPPVGGIASKALVINAFDLGTPLSGLGQVTVSVDGGPPTAVAGSGSHRNFIPPGGWKPGTHTVEAVALDQAGNIAKASTTFSIHPRFTVDTTCLNDIVQRAVRDATSLNRTLRRIGKLPHGDLFRRFNLDRAYCTDLTGDRQTELVVLLRDMDEPKSVLAIFRRQGSSWSLAFQDAKHRIDQLSTLGSDLIEKVHRTRHHKARSIRVHWSGSGFELIPA